MSTSRPIKKIADEFRCLQCKKLLAKADLNQHIVEIKCTRCGAVNAVFKGITDQVIITDPDGIILYANSLVESVTGYSLSEILGKRPSLWGGQMPTPFYKKMWREIKVMKRPIVVRVTNRKKNGEKYNALLRISPVMDTKGDIKMFVGMETIIE